jgi:hypothetical protein
LIFPNASALERKAPKRKRKIFPAVVSSEKYREYYQDEMDKKLLPTKKDPVLLIDNHATHCTLEAYSFCIENGIVIVRIPSHTSHRLQPLDVSLYFGLKTSTRHYHFPQKTLFKSKKIYILTINFCR